MTLKEFSNELLTVCPSVSHFEAKTESLPRIIYAETRHGGTSFDNSTGYIAYEVEVHVYTKTEFDPMIDNLEEMFKRCRIPWEMPEGGIQFGRDTKGRDGVIYYRYNITV